jgi:Uma2 family endonuclease
VEEYFLLEKNNPDTCYEYLDGYIYAMSGGTFNHDTIKSNLQRILWGLLRGGKCRVYSSDMRVYISRERYFQPDVTVTCDPRDRGTGDLLQSPRLVIEVLSPSTELKDRTWKTVVDPRSWRQAISMAGLYCLERGSHGQA